jgi:hypothetical protein
MSADFTRVRDTPKGKWDDDRPLIVPPDGGEPIPYERASSFGGVLEDKELLEAWKRRQTAIGVAQRPDLILAVNTAVTAAGANKWKLKTKIDRLVKQAMDYAGSGARASMGTSMHEVQQTHDEGRDVGYLPPEYRRDLDAYIALTEPLLEHLAIEAPCVCDELKAAGTTDRVSRLKRDLVCPDGVVIEKDSIVIGDGKTSRSLDFSQLKFLVQGATYAHSVPYDTETDERSSWAGEVRTDWGLIIHCPVGEGTARLVRMNLTAGWEFAQLSSRILDARERAAALMTEVMVEVAMEAA